MQRKGKLESIEAARAIATFLVVTNHIAIDSKHWLGFEIFPVDFPCMRAAVIFFFVLSGFIMCYAHWNDMGGGYQKVKDYSIKRITRIFPTYWLILVIVTLMYLFLGSYFSSKDPTSHLMTLNLTWATSLKNVFLINYPANPIVLVVWTMEFEILFYLVFALFMINVRLASLAIFCWLTLIILFNLGCFSASFSLVKFLLNSCNAQLISGCFIAYILNKWNSKKFFMPYLILLIALTGLITTGLFDVLSKNLLVTSNSTLLYAIFSFFLVLALVKIEFIKKVSCPKILVTLGMAAYPIYLTHHLTQSILFRLAHHVDFGGKDFLIVRYVILVSLIFVFSILVGYLFYKFYDLPVTSYIRKKIKEKKIRLDVDFKLQEVEAR